MGSQCASKFKKTQKIEYFTDQSKITFGQISTMKSMLSKVTCPIENLKIIDKKRQIDEKYPYCKNWEKQNNDSDQKMKWQKLQIDNHQEYKCWFYGEEEVDQLNGYGMLYVVGRYSQYLIEGQFKHKLVIPQKNYLKIFGNGDIYIGPLNSQFQPEGFGQMTYENQNVYKGEFRYGLPQGQGVMTRKKDRFQGKFKKGQKLKGTLQTSTQIYKGNFRNGLKDGEGTLIQKEGGKYVGKFKSNKKHGFGYLYDVDGNLVIKGTWKKDKYQ